MKYETPHVELLESALTAIQSGEIKKVSSTADGNGRPSQPPAYEADE